MCFNDFIYNTLEDNIRIKNTEALLYKEVTYYLNDIGRPCCNVEVR